MTKERKLYWYTIVTYIPSYIRCERANVGAIMGNNEQSWLRYLFIPMNSKKIQAFLYNHVEEKYEYENYITCLRNLFAKSYTEINLFNYTVKEGKTNWAEYLGVKELPECLEFSDTQFAETADPDMIFKHLI